MVASYCLGSGKRRKDKKRTVIAASPHWQSQTLQFYTTKFDFSLGRLRIARRRLCRNKIDGEVQNRRRLERAGDDALAAQFDHAGDGGMAASDEAAMTRFENNPVVADETGEFTVPAGHFDEGESEVAFSGA